MAKRIQPPMTRSRAFEVLQPHTEKLFRSVWNMPWAQNSFHDAVFCLCPDFEYPDWDYRTVGQLLRWSLRNPA
jgi:hypothetical protein